MSKALLRLLVCDDSADARAAVRTLLSDQPEIEIVGEAANGKEAVALADELSPDVVLMDVSMPVLDGIEATRRIRKLLPETRIVALAGSRDPETVMAAMEAGANAYCLKGAPLWELERAIGGAHGPLLRLAQGLARSVASGKGELVARELAQLTGAALAAVYTVEPRVDLALSGERGVGGAGSSATLARVARRALRKAAVVRADELELAELSRFGAPSSGAVAVPLVADGETLGALVVAMPAEGDLIADPEFLSAVADLAAASFATDRRLAESHAEARRDALTGLPNRRAFEEALRHALREARSLSRELSVVLLDLDDFKLINDTRGHPAGDEVLRRVGLVLARMVRADEAVFRIGGEEFAILVESGSSAGRLVADRVRAALREQRRGERLPTVSAGVASVPGDAKEEAELLRKADAALYAAKWAGKDRVLAYCAEVEAAATEAVPTLRVSAEPRLRRVLLVDDDAGLRSLLRTTLEPADLDVDEAADAETAAARIDAKHPDVVVLDIRMPGMDGLTFCRRLKADLATRDTGVVLLTADDEERTEAAARAAGADAFLRKPFSPLQLLDVVERLAGGRRAAPPGIAVPPVSGEQVQLYAQDLRRLLEIERGQRTLLQKAYREAVTALATALESKDTSTKAHSQRVQRYALELAKAVDPSLLSDPSLEYGFLLHDVGKIGIPDRVLLKPGPLAETEERLMRTHPVLGEQMLCDVALLQGEGLKVVRSHHERWDGGGYPDGIAGREISLGARIFAVADTLDAMTSERPYRSAGSWSDAVEEIEQEAGHQFDPEVVRAFATREPALRLIHGELTAV